MPLILACVILTQSELGQSNVLLSNSAWHVQIPNTFKKDQTSELHQRNILGCFELV